MWVWWVMGALAAPVDGLLVGGGANGGGLGYPGDEGLAVGPGAGVDLVLGFAHLERQAGLRAGWQFSGGAIRGSKGTDVWGEWVALQVGGYWSLEGPTYHTATVGTGIGGNSAASPDMPAIIGRVDYAYGMHLAERTMLEIGPYASVHFEQPTVAHAGVKLHLLGLISLGSRSIPSYSPRVPAVPDITLPNLPAIQLQCEYFGYDIPSEWLPACEEAAKPRGGDRRRDGPSDGRHSDEVPSDTGDRLVQQPSDTRQRKGLVDPAPGGRRGAPDTTTGPRAGRDGVARDGTPGRGETGNRKRGGPRPERGSTPGPVPRDVRDGKAEPSAPDGARPTPLVGADKGRKAPSGGGKASPKAGGKKKQAGRKKQPATTPGWVDELEDVADRTGGEARKKRTRGGPPAEDGRNPATKGKKKGDKKKGGKKKGAKKKRSQGDSQRPPEKRKGSERRAGERQDDGPRKGGSRGDGSRG